MILDILCHIDKRTVDGVERDGFKPISSSDINFEPKNTFNNTTFNAPSLENIFFFVEDSGDIGLYISFDELFNCWAITGDSPAEMFDCQYKEGDNRVHATISSKSIQMPQKTGVLERMFCGTLFPPIMHHIYVDKEILGKAIQDAANSIMTRMVTELKTKAMLSYLQFRIPSLTDEDAHAISDTADVDFGDYMIIQMALTPRQFAEYLESYQYTDTDHDQADTIKQYREYGLDIFTGLDENTPTKVKSFEWFSKNIHNPSNYRTKINESVNKFMSDLRAKSGKNDLAALSGIKTVAYRSRRPAPPSPPPTELG